MSGRYDPRSAFSPYEFGVARSLMLSIGAFALLALFLLDRGAPFAVPGLFAIVLTIIVAANVLQWLSRCPNCGKAATMRLLSNRKLDGLRLFQVQRAWPERICGECGQDLTVIARRG
jgi:hypothetical protein